MMDYYLSVHAEADMPETPEGASVDVIGSWTDASGWHFNVRSVSEIDWPESVTQSNPVTPWRVWG